MAATH